ncbi:MAG TPA: hypothetical protein VHY79_03445 [Rhizomicrobium sp.]|nr:hypothetical protein [Rhizomicrobium sp.]
MDGTGLRAIAFMASAILVAGCGVVTGHRSFGYTATGTETSSVSTEIGTSSGSIASAQVDPCTLDLDNPVWRDHGGRPAYEKRCGHPPPR